MNNLLRVPCTYQGGKQRFASQIVDHLLTATTQPDTQFYDLCCGSGAISIELVNRGIAPSRIKMLDISSWGVFWSAIGSDSFKMDVFDHLLSGLPSDKHDFKAHMMSLSKLPVGEHEAEIYPILQSCSFGGKQIWREKGKWINTGFRNYWQPTATSVRRSPINPMQPTSCELRRRIYTIVTKMKGITCFNTDIMTILDTPFPDNAVVYVDPPYQKTTKYGFNFDIALFISHFLENNSAPLFVSEGRPLNKNSIMLEFRGAKGGISGNKKGKHQEWLSKF